MNRILVVVTIVWMLSSFPTRVHCQLSNLFTCKPGTEYQTLTMRGQNRWDPTTADASMDTVRKAAEQRQLPALYLLARIGRTGYQAIDNVPHATVAHLLEMEKEVQACDDGDVKAYFYFLLARYYHLAKDFPNMFHYVVQCRSILEEYGYEKLKLSGYFVHCLQEYYLQFQDYPTAVFFGEKSVEINDTFPSHLPYKLNNLGVAYLKMKDYQKAAATFKKVIEVAPQYAAIYEAIGAGNYGNTLRLQGRYREAIPYFYYELHQQPAEALGDCAVSCLHLADCLLHLDSIAKAKVYIDSSLKYTIGWIVDDFWTHYYDVLGLYYLKSNQFEKAAQAQQRFIHIKDSMQNLYDVRISMAKSLQAKEEKLLQEQQRSEQKAARIRYNRNLIIIVLSTAFFLIFLFTYQKKKREQRLILEKQQRAEAQLQQAQEKLQQYLANIKEKNDLIEKIERDFSSLQSQLEKQQTQPYLEQLQQSVILTDEDWEKFKQLCEQAWPGMFAELHEKYPGLSRSEERLLALGKLNISSKQMANMIGISISSLRTSRYRLRKKYPSLNDTAEFGEEEG